MLFNLLSDAARQSTESSGIRVSAVSEGIHVAVSVTDEGRGIPAESMPLLFHKFSQAQPEDQSGDTGLGLAICKGIVEAHGGRIWAESEGLAWAPVSPSRCPRWAKLRAGRRSGLTGMRSAVPRRNSTPPATGCPSWPWTTSKHVVLSWWPPTG